MTTNDTLASKLKAITDNETQLLANIQAVRSQIQDAEKNLAALEERRHVFAGAKLIIQELQKEATSDEPAETPAPVAPIEVLPAQN